MNPKDEYVKLASDIVKSAQRDVVWGPEFEVYKQDLRERIAQAIQTTVEQDRKMRFVIEWPSESDGCKIPGDPDLEQRMRLASKLAKACRDSEGEDDEWEMGFTEGSIATSRYLKSQTKLVEIKDKGDV